VCTITATAPDGTTVTSDGNGSFDVPDGTKVHLFLPEAFDGATNLQGSCRPFTGEG
jgi:hypothetical protein